MAAQMAGQADHEGTEVIQMFAKEVHHFSSQYGSETSLSYTVPNLASRCAIYPDYGDFTQTCVFRTYGPWWSAAPSAAPKYVRTPVFFNSVDYVELIFDVAVYPSKLEIFETYNPGAVVRILACDLRHIRWVTLWSGRPEKAPSRSRIFSPTLKRNEFPTNFIRIELNHKYCDYYTELDSVRLSGIPSCESSPISILKDLCGPPSDCQTALREYGTPVDPFIPDDHHSDHHVTTNQEDRPPVHQPTSGTTSPESSYTIPPEVKHKDEGSVQGVKSCLESHVLELSRLHIQDGLSAALDPVDNGYFDLLPYEVIQLILSKLDLVALCHLAATCRLLWHHCYDPMQYVELDLQPFWSQVCDTSLTGVRSRCCHLQRLNLSWCGGYSLISINSFSSFLQVCGPSLVCLQLACCRFVTEDAISAIVTYCCTLQELDLQCNRKLSSSSFHLLSKLSHLQRLNLYRTTVDVTSLVKIIRSSPNMEVLNLGACCNVNDFDEVLIQLSLHCRKLRCIDLWRARTISEVGLFELIKNCSQLEEIDVGWCPNLRSASGVFVEVANRCPRLRKFFLTANRTVCDADLEAVACHCPQLEQLDILGTREVSIKAAQGVLERCRKLQMFDVSFCTGIDFVTVKKWTDMFPAVSIKKSFQSLSANN